MRGVRGEWIFSRAISFFATQIDEICGRGGESVGWKRFSRAVGCVISQILHVSNWPYKIRNY